jgi:F-type H+-transporting ATPase subunit c
MIDLSTLPWDKIYVIVTVIVAGFGIALGITFPAIGQGIVAFSGLKAIARQPEAGDRINSLVLLSLAMLESLAIYVLAVILILVFANPMRSYILGS